MPQPIPKNGKTIVFLRRVSMTGIDCEMFYLFFSQMGVKKITVLHKRNACIGCGSCALLDPKHWEMDTTDGKACLRNAQWKGSTYMVGQVDADEIQATRKAEHACPVQIIKVHMESGTLIFPPDKK